MKYPYNRRDFFKTCAQAGIACCALIATPRLFALQNGFPFLVPGEKPDPKKLNYCGYTCPAECTFKNATLDNDLEMKKKAWEEWKIKERYGLDFDEKTAYCYGCKDKEHPAGAPMANCTVRSCTISKGLDCCIECDELKTCDKDLWSRFPQFHEGILKLQAQFRAG